MIREPNAASSVARSLHPWLFTLAILGLLRSTCAQTVDVPFPARQCVAFDDSSHVLLVGGHSLARLDLKTLKVGSRHDFDPLSFAAASRFNSHKFALGGTSEIEQGFVGVCTDAELPEFAWTLKDLEHRVTAICINSQAVLAGNDAGEVAAFDIRDGHELWRWQSHSKLVTCLTPLSADLCASADWVGKIVLFDPATGVEISNFQQHRDRVTGLLPSIGDGPLRLYSASRDGTVRLWYPQQRRLVRFVQLEEPVTALCVLSNSRVAVATRDAQIHCLDMNTAQVLSSQPSDMEFISSLFTVDDSTVLALTGKGQVRRLSVP